MRPPKIIKRFNFTVLAIAICALLSACSKPDYQTADGANGRFADLRGKWLLINYWAEWCKPCIEEIPELNRFHQQFAANATVLAVNYDNVQGEKLQEQIKHLQIAMPVLQQDPSTQLGYQRPDALPTTLVFNPEGKLTATLMGPQTVATLADAIGQAAPAPQSASAQKP